MANQRETDEYTFEREIRFAVVIYGGVSLAIYINGVVQELLGMVRSTSSKLPDDQLTGPERVYRELASQIGGSAIVPDHARTSEPGKVGLIDRNAKVPPDTSNTGYKPRTKFVVDILSGTSAGGINAVFLAKALAHGSTLTSLAEM